MPYGKKYLIEGMVKAIDCTMMIDNSTKYNGFDFSNTNNYLYYYYSVGCQKLRWHLLRYEKAGVD